MKIQKAINRYGESVLADLWSYYTRTKPTLDKAIIQNLPSSDASEEEFDYYRNGVELAVDYLGVFKDNRLAFLPEKEIRVRKEHFESFKIWIESVEDLASVVYDFKALSDNLVTPS